MNATLSLVSSGAAQNAVNIGTTTSPIHNVDNEIDENNNFDYNYSLLLIFYLDFLLLFFNLVIYYFY